jgi:hypothetical protein
MVALRKQLYWLVLAGLFFSLDLGIKFVLSPTKQASFLWVEHLHRQITWYFPKKEIPFNLNLHVYHIQAAWQNNLNFIC